MEKQVAGDFRPRGATIGRWAHPAREGRLISRSTVSRSRVAAAETERDRKLTARIAELGQRFVDGPVLTLPGNGSGTFDIRGAVVIPGSGTVYFSSYRMSGDWGSIDASTGVLVSLDRGYGLCPAPSGRTGH